MYQEFRIKLPVGCKVKIEGEDTHAVRDPYALLCKVPHSLYDKVLETVMKSKSRQVEYKVREVAGKPVGHVQHFLNKTFVQLLEVGRIKSVRVGVEAES